MNDLVAEARAFFAPGKGMLALDESVASATKRLAEYGIASSEETRRQFRDLFVDAKGIEQYLSGVIFFSETLDDKGSDGKLFPESLTQRGVSPGIKVDLGTEEMPGSPHELITKGLLDLAERLPIYKKQGATFTKWRAALRIEGDTLPSALAIHENAKRLAQYAKEVQNAGMVPILEPEILLEGKHSRVRSRVVLEQTLQTLFSVLKENSVDIASLILKSSMTLSGNKTGRVDTPDEVAKDTVDAFLASVPRQIAGIVFLSGGQTPDQATANLAAITRYAKEKSTPWPLTFCYARALQEEALSIWRGKQENVEGAREVFLTRLVKVSAALGV